MFINSRPCSEKHSPNTAAFSHAVCRKVQAWAAWLRPLSCSRRVKSKCKYWSSAQQMRSNDLRNMHVSTVRAKTVICAAQDKGKVENTNRKHVNCSVVFLKGQ